MSTRSTRSTIQGVHGVQVDMQFYLVVCFSADIIPKVAFVLQCSISDASKESPTARQFLRDVFTLS